MLLQQDKPAQLRPFKATRKRVYEALTDEKKFSQVSDFVMKGASTQISREVGGSVSIFDGVITGRHVELVPDERIVQAWREKDWPVGLYFDCKVSTRGAGPGNKSGRRSHRKAQLATSRQDSGRIAGNRCRSMWDDAGL